LFSRKNITKTKRIISERNHHPRQAAGGAAAERGIYAAAAAERGIYATTAVAAAERVSEILSFTFLIPSSNFRVYSFNILITIFVDFI
jgi:hypothetical protein